MRVDELVTGVLTTGRLSSSDPDYTSARIRQELTDSLHTVFGGRILKSGGGYWLKFADTAITTGRTRYRLPYRAAGISSIQVVDSSGNDQGSLEYEIHGDQVQFRNAPTAGLVLRVFYYLRPSTLVQEQTAGLVTAVDTDALTVTVNSVPTNRVTAVAVASGDKVDIVHSNGWHELAVVGTVASLSSTTFTFPSGTDLSDVIENEDYVRAAEQTDWPCISDDYDRALIDVTAASILRSRRDFQKADALMAKAEGTPSQPGDLMRFVDVIEPRVEDARPTCVPSVGVLRGRIWRGFRAAAT